MATVEDLLSGFSPEVGELALRARQLVQSVFPDAVESVNLGWKNIWFGKGPRMRDTVFVINPLRDAVNLNIANATSIEDRDHLLEGTGKSIRHVKIRRTEDLERPEVRRLLQDALRHNVD